ncbi:AMP-dependent synthetase/ligase [Agilicoccus flavus]|uniref:AMP-dependent synthetase/ligase n=1 Tax=Agilicoccus flavus TaxID=2775968 RepID=UPI001CF667F5|nr:AMP-dependent synthetase/ligase [Agilicoccus flavus]
MREIVVPPLPRAGSGAAANLSDLPVHNARRFPDRVVFGRRQGNLWHDVTAAAFLSELTGVAKGLMAAGIGPGDRVGIMSRTRYEWTLLDFAIWSAGAVPVPIYETSSEHQLEWIVQDAGIVALFVESTDHLVLATRVRDSQSHLAHVWHIDGGALDELTAAGAEVTDADHEARRTGATLDDLATIIYTSGTTGRPKGCELTHGNFVLLSENVCASLPEIVAGEGSATLLFLPLAHVLARLIQVVAVMSGMRVGHSPDVKNLMDDLGSFEPTFLLAVPRVFEKIYNATDTKLRAQGKARLFAIASRTAIAYSRSLDSGGPSVPLRVRHAALDLVVYRKLRALMGGKVQFAVSGGAPLGERLGHFFRGIGLTILEGYGLTETTAPTNVCTPSMTKVGTVGRPLPGVGIRVADDGEVQVSGVGVFRAYHDNDEATREAMTDDGWFRTGDLGEIDDDGCLRITGRSKEIIVTMAGKNVSPAGLEDVVRAHPLVGQCLVVGDGRPFVGALVTIDPEMVQGWGASHGRADLTAESAVDDPFVREHIQMAVDRANQTVSRAESIREFVILPGDFTEESGHLTPSMKLKRNVVTADFADAIDSLYDNAHVGRQG